MSDPLAIASPSARSRWPLVLVVLVALLAMGRAAGNDWAYYDDDLFLFRNPHYNPPTFSSLGYYWSHGFKGLWTPLTHSAWWLVAKLAILDVAEPGGIRLNPWMFHAFNVIAHAGSSALVFPLVRRAVNSTWSAIAGAFVFAAHPVQVEAVAWTTGTKDLLATLFMLAALLAATAERPRWTHVAVAIALSTAAMLSKPSAVVLPAMLVVFAWMLPFEDSRERRSGVRWVALISALLAIPVLIVARYVQEVVDVPPVPLFVRPLVAMDALAQQLWHAVLPIGHAADYGFTPDTLLASSRRWWIWLVPVGVALLAWRSRDRIVIGAAALFVIALAPNLGLASFQFQVYSTVADRYAYPAMLAIALVVARSLASSDVRLPRASIAIAVLLALVLVPISILRCGDWRGPDAIWSRTLTINPNSSLAHNNLGATLAGRGRIEEAIAHFEASASNNGASQNFALLNLAQLQLRLGNADAAADATRRLLEGYRRRAEFDPELYRQTLDRFARQIERLDPRAAERLRESAK